MRRAVAGTLAAAVLAMVALVLSAGPAGAATTTITASLSVRSTTFTSTVHLAGNVDRPTATPKVVVQRLVDGRWSDRVAGAVDQSTGRYRIALTPSRKGTYVLRVRSNGGSVVSRELTLVVHARPTTITAGLSATSVLQGTSARVQGKVVEPDAIDRVVVQRRIGSTWSDRVVAAVDQRTGAFSAVVTPSEAGTYVLRVRSEGGTKFSGTLTLTSTPRALQVITYSVTTRGSPASDVEAFARHAASTMADRRGWSMGGSIEFRRVASGGDLTLVLSASGSVPSFGPPCDASYSCRSGRYVIINDLRWRSGAPGWAGSLDEYHHYVVNHELGHWLGQGHVSCPGVGAAAPVMQQQSIRTSPCVNTVWPLAGERDQVARRRGVPIR